MFYSQFILAKKGPLGTIWIAAHLERKLRKNQVADTDIGVSVDSILSPDVPIALRLSSHLLLGVVRIYNKKVGYLFDDCSEALLKVKQAFRSTAVDLPPEESKAPYHSITLPEKFDLDDFELPDSDIFQGNYVDHHISSREQITLQDTMEGVSYSTSKFGLDERFSDGDVSGLDLEEELLLGNIGIAEHGDERADLHASFGSTSAVMQGQHPEDRAADSEAMVDGDESANILVYSHAPSTPRLVDEPNFSKVQEASACDDHLESEYHLTGSANMDSAPCENKQELENGHLSGWVEVKESELQGQIDSIKPPSECKESEAFTEDTKDLVSIDEARCNDHVSNDVEVPFSEVDTSNQQKSCHAVPESASEVQDALILSNTETQACQGTDGASVNLDAHDKEAATETIVLRPFNSVVCPLNDVDVKSDICVEATNGGEETTMLGQVHHLNDNSEHNVEENHSSGAANGLVHATAELPAPEKLLSVPEGHIDLHNDLIMEVSPRDFDGFDAGSKTASGRKRTFTESTLTEQSLNSVQSSRQVHIKRTAGSVPDDDDLLSSILVGRNTSILRVKPTPPPSEVTSMKRSRAAPRSGAPKRKVLMDDTMVLHGDSIRKQLTHAEDIRRVRRKAPCTLSEISMIRKQHMEDETFLEPVFTGMSVELTSLRDQVYDLGQINVCKTEVHDASLEVVSENRNRNFLETMVEPNVAPSTYLETMMEFHSTSSNNRSHDVEDDKGPGKANVTEVSGQVLDDEFLTVRDNDNETAEPCENRLPTENKTEEVDYTSTAVNEESKPTPDRDNSAATSDMVHALDGIIQTASINESERTNAHVNIDTAGFLDQSNTLPSTELDFVDVHHEQAITKVTEKDDNGGENAIELGLKDDFLLDTIEPIPNDDHGNLEYHVKSQNHSTTSKELLDEEFPCTGLESMLQGGSINTRENPDHPFEYQVHTMDGDVSGFDLHDPDELSYLAAGNDTEFLNVDDDDLSEMADDSMPDAEDTQYSENSGWSSRTRAVSKYLQAAFVKEADSGRSSLSLENLLIGKSRKEASRMFFETLVLKTRDYIHVEQRNPFGDTTIRPRARLMKSDL